MGIGQKEASGKQCVKPSHTQIDNLILSLLIFKSGDSGAGDGIQGHCTNKLHPQSFS